MPVRGTNLLTNAHITGIGSGTITISGLVTATVPSGTNITVTNQSLLLRTTAAQTSAGTTLTVASTAGLIVGQSAFGFGISSGARVASIPSATTFTLSVPTTEALGNHTLITIINTTAPGVVRVAQGSVVTDGNGNPIVVTPAQNQFLIPSIMFDGRLYASTDPSDKEIISSIYSLLQNYANQVVTLDAGLLESSEVYYRPARTMGYAVYGTGNSLTSTLPLELSFTISLYVSLAVYNNINLITTMQNTIISILNTSIQSSPISIANIESTIVTQLGSNIEGIAMGGINNNDSLRLIALEDSSSTPSLEYILVRNTDGSVSRVPNVTFNWIVAPDSASAEVATTTASTATTTALSS
jgi:hypothetical protein